MGTRPGCAVRSASKNALSVPSRTTRRSCVSLNSGTTRPIWRSWAPAADHFLRTKIKPLYVDWNPQKEDANVLKKKLQQGMEKYRKDYAQYYQRCRRENSPALRDPNPTVILIPGWEWWPGAKTNRSRG